MSSSPFLASLSLEAIKSVLPSQAYKLGRVMVSCGDVAGIQICDTKENKVKVSGYIHASRAVHTWYHTSVWFNPTDGTGDSPECPCLANPDPSKLALCKHVGALLLGCFALNEYSDITERPLLFRRSNINRYANADPKLKAQVAYDETWSQIVEKLRDPPPKKADFSAVNDVIITKYSENRPKKKPKVGLTGLTVEKLKEKCREKGLKVSGKKEDLIKRLEEAEKQELIIRIPSRALSDEINK